MNNTYKKNAKLVLSNGIIFPGFSFGAFGTAVGEIVFNTGMTGYQEVINDNTVAGLEVNNKPIFSVQYHPEAGPGPHDSDYLFNKFVSLMLERC